MFVIDDIDFWEKRQLSGLTMGLGMAGLVAPVLFGFAQIGLIISLLLIISAAITAALIQSAISEISKRLASYRKDDYS